MKNAFKKENRVLLVELVRTDFKLRYQGSILGYSWSLLKPLLLFATLYVVFVRFLKIGSDIPHYPIYLLFGIVLWTFFAEITGQGIGSVVGRGDLIRKIRIPRWIIVLSSSISALINLSLNMIIVLVFLFLNHVDLLITTLWLPIILLEIFVLGFGFSLLLSALYVKYRDITHIWEVVMQAMFYVTPILFPLTLIKNVFFQKLLLLNPMAQAIQDARYSLVTHDPRNITLSRAYGSDIYYLIPLAFCLVIFVLGIWYFKREAKNFAENL